MYQVPMFCQVNVIFIIIGDSGKIFTKLKNHIQMLK